MTESKLFRKNKEIKTIIIVLTFSIIMTCGLVFYFGGLNNSQFKNAMIENNQKHMLDTVKAGAEHLEDRLNYIKLELALLALNPAVRESFAEDVNRDGLSNEANSSVTTSFTHIENMTYSIYRIDSKGFVLERVPYREDIVGNDYSEKPGVKYVLQNKTPFISELFVTNYGFKAISVCVPVFGEGELTGLLRAIIHLESISDAVSKIKKGKRGYAWLIDDRGVHIHHPDPIQIGRDKMQFRKNKFSHYDWAELENIVYKMKSGEEGVGVYHSVWWTEENPSHVKKLIAYSPVDLGNERWSMGLSMGYDEIDAIIKKHVILTFGIYSVIILFLIGSALTIYIVQKKKVKLEITAQSAEELKKANVSLKGEMEERKLVEKALSEERNMLRTLLDNLPDLIYIKDTEGRFLTCNAESAKFLGAGKISDVIDKTDFDFFPWELASKFYHNEQEIIRTGRPLINREELSINSLGQTRWFFVTKVPILDIKGNVTGVVGISRDITERKHLEEQLQMRQRMDSIGTLGAGIAHDFNNLLAGIMGYLDILININSNDLSKTQKEYIENALKSCTRAADLVKQFQSLAKGTVSRKTSVDLYEASKEVFNLLGKTTDKLISKEIELSPDEFYVYADPSELNQVLLNLGTNAVNALTEKGIKPGARISIKAKEYTITGKDKTGLGEGDYIHIFFEDNGIGMTKDVKRQAFDPLFTTGEKSSQKGQGLGLAMVFNIVTRRHDGYIDIESARGKGTTMHIYLPKAHPRQQLDEGEVKVVPCGNETVLIVDDEETVLNFAKSVLDNYGYNTLTAFDGKQGLDIYEKNKDSIDLILLDLTMPEMSGRMLLKEILHIQPAAKVIISSGHSEEDTSKGIFTKAKACILKPYKASDLAQTLRAVLDR
jgi:PAS domain S-box-containing protein